MAVSSGDKIGRYEVLGLLGTGGMGEVYRARDTRLGRDVALKVLPDRLATDADYLARFEREAQVLASLNHPNIAAIYGIEDNAIVMELVEGKTLADSGTLSVEEALHCARQIAEALEVAHATGIIHRDLKPANVKLTPNGSVKVLDFGLAKSQGDSGVADSNPQDSPTLTVRGTQAGVILGTAGYMSPEQAAGKPVDRRSDIWSFGVVLYEMLAGERMFRGETISHTLADVLRAEIDFSKLPADTPPMIRELVARCLNRKVNSRLQCMGDARVLIEHCLAHPQQVAVADPVAVRSRRAWIAASCVLGIAAIASGVLAWRVTRPVEKPLLRFTEHLGRDVVLVDMMTGPSPRNGPNVIISPDGSRLVFVSLEKDGRTRLFTRRLDEPNATRIEGTDGAVGPFFSPNSKWVGFFASGNVKKVALDGGTPTDLGSIANPISGTWAEENIVIGTMGGGLVVVPERGGAPKSITQLETGETSHRWATVLPGGKSVVYAAGIGGNMGAGKIVAQRLDTGERKLLQSGASFPRYLASGHLIFVNNGVLYAGRFDPQRLEFVGTAAPVLQDVKYAQDSGAAQLDVSREGVLVYRGGSNHQTRMLSWVDRTGRIEPALPSAALYGTPRISPDGKRVALWLLESGQSNIWIFDLARRLGARVTFEPGATRACWAPDGRHIVYSSPTGVYWTRADGGGKPVRLLERGLPEWFTPDGKRLGYVEVTTPGRPCRIVAIEGDSEQPRAGKPEPCFESDAETRPSSDLHPNGRWIAYSSLASGKSEIYVRRFPDHGGRWQISNSGGSAPKWSADGRAIIYIDDAESRLMIVPLQIGADSLIPGQPEPWVGSRTAGGTAFFLDYSPSPDGKRILLNASPTGDARDAHVQVALNFFDEIRRRLRTAETK